MRNRRGSGSGASVLATSAVFVSFGVVGASCATSGLAGGWSRKIPQSPQAQGTSRAAKRRDASSQPSSQPPGSQGSGVQDSTEPTSARCELHSRAVAHRRSPPSQPPGSQGSGP